LILGILLSLLSCAQPTPPEEVYFQAQADLREGNLVAAQDRLLSEVGYWEREDPYWHAKLLLLLAEVRLSQGRVDEAIELLSTPDLQIHSNKELEVRRLTSLGNAYLKRSRYRDSDRTLQAASDLLGETKNPILLEIELLKSQLDIQNGEIVEAERRLRAVEEQARLQGDNYYGAAALNNLGLMRIRKYRYDEAVPWLEEARTASLKAGARRFTAAILGNLSLCYTRLGNFDRALELRQEAMELQEAIGDSIGLQYSFGEAGNLHFFQHQYDPAGEYYRRAYELAQEIGSVSDASKWAGNLATTYIETQQWQEAQEFNEIARDLKSEIGDLESLPYSWLNQAAIEAGQGRFQEAELLYEKVVEQASENPALQWEAHAGLGELYLGRDSMSDADRHFERAIQLIDHTRSDLMRQDFRITFLSRLIRFYQRYVEVLMQRGHLERALQVIESSRARALNEGFQVENDAWADWTLERLKRTAGSQGVVFLSYWLAPERSYVWAVNDKDIRAVPLAGEEELQRLVDNYQRAILNLRDPLGEANEAGKSLFAKVVEPIRDLIPRGSRVVIVPDGCLHSINLETLPVGSPEARYWIEEVTVVVSPTLRITSFPFQPFTGGKREVLLVGNPTPVEPEYPRLRYATDEIDSLRRSFGDRVKLLAGDQATASNFLESKPGRFPLIHFTAHAEANRTSPLDSAVILTPQEGDYKLYARDLLGAELSADLVTVSACRGAGARAYAGEGLIGFAWALLHAGARNVVAGLWDVSDASTAELIGSFYKNLAADDSVPVALRKAKLELIQSPGNYRKPFYWGPFQVYVR